MQEIWEVAKRIELEGKNHYLSLARDTEIEEIAAVFHFLAAQEEEHFALFLSMQDNKKPARRSSQKAKVVAQEAFRAIAAGFSGAMPLVAPADAIEKAIDLEEKTARYYRSLLDNEDLKENRAILATIADEEREHTAVLESIREFAQKPQEWLRNWENRYDT